jgi:hypothetical protein
LVLSNLHMKTCSLHYMSMSGMSAIVLACQLAHMACVAELPKKGVRHLLSLVYQQKILSLTNFALCAAFVSVRVFFAVLANRWTGNRFESFPREQKNRTRFFTIFRESSQHY